VTLRIGIASFMQESNSFAPKLTELSDFDVLVGSAVTDFFLHTNSEIAGFFDGCKEQSWRPVPLISANAISGGPLSPVTFERLCLRLVELAQGDSLDALLLALHGAMSATHLPNADVEIVRRLRRSLGSRVPIVVSHDLHANLAPELLQYVDALSGYRTYPHVDQCETGRRACRMLGHIISGKSIRHWHLQIPMLLSPQASSTFEHPMKELVDSLDEFFKESEGNYPSLFLVQPWLDYYDVAGSLAVTQINSKIDIGAHMRGVAAHLWSLRKRLKVDWVSRDRLIEVVRCNVSRPVLISEAADAPTAGAAGDNTILLQCLLPEADALRSCIFLVDAEVVSRARNSGLGAEIQVEIGATVDRRYSNSIPVRARVERLSTGEFFAKGPAFSGRRFSMGPTAVLSISKLLIVAASKPVMMIDPELYRSQGIEPANQDAVGIKSALLFRPAYKEISQTIVHLDSPGSCRGRIEKVPFQRIQRPIYPLDEFEWDPPAPTCIRPLR
jgi:microcystin degradation protein MlrC